MAGFNYDEVGQSATFELDSGRTVKVSNVTRERAERFLERLKAEEQAMAARGQRGGDPLTFTGPAGILTRSER